MRAITRLIAVLLPLGAVAACGDSEADETTTREIITRPGTEEVEVTVPTVDTAVVRTTIDVDTAVDVDVIENPAVEKTDP